MTSSVISTVVSAIDRDCPAHLALLAEGVDHEVAICRGDTGYGELLAALWRSGRGFVLVEHDIAPWAGAIKQLMECERDWCMFRYMKHGGQLMRGLGCAKFSSRLVRDYPDLASEWQDVSWQVLDGVVGGAVAQVLRAEDPRHPLCTHEPPVAHVRRLGD